jgi:hypothetical protein
MVVVKVNGYALRAALTEARLRLDAVSRMFKDSVMAFPGEEKPSPKSLDEEIVGLDDLISEIETAQATYNLKVRAGEMPLIRAVKLVGPRGRNAKLWREAAAPSHERYGGGYYEHTRDKDSIVAAPQIDRRAALDIANTKASQLAALRAAIATANATPVEIDISESASEYVRKFVS